jgi:sugar O-acyltransferase (sialic acid O-acetyltransferase NeuD family)
VASNELILIGAGGHASVVAESAVAAGWRILGYLASEPTKEAKCGALQVPWLGSPEAPNPEGERLLAGGARLHAAAGDARFREACLLRFGAARFATITHPGNWISPTATLGFGAYVGPFAVVNATAAIGAATIVNSGAVVEHGVQVGPCAHVAPRSVLAGLASVGARTLVGAGAVVLPFVSIGSDAVVGAGATVARDVPDGATVVGTPARPIAR